MAQEILVTVIRHGETADNASKIIQGHIDTPLNSTGEEQSRLTGQYLARIGRSFDAVFSSDLQRARKTAELILEAQASAGGEVQASIVQDQRIRERFLGDLQGKVYDPNHDDSSAEPRGPYLARILSFWDDLLPPSSTPSPQNLLSDELHKESSARPLQVLLTSHGGPIRTVVRALIDDPERAMVFGESLKGTELPHRVQNCGVTEIRARKEEGKARWHLTLERYTDGEHLRLKKGTIGHEGETGVSADQDI